MAVVPTHVALPGRYRVIRHIANGGMASVYVADDELLERLVAVKVLAGAYAADESARRRFRREARAAARVSDHPHVVTIYDIGETPEVPPQAFIVMEHFAGGTVADRLGRGVPIPVPTALRWLKQAASALDAAHAADIVHRDVKPANLLLDDRGRLAVGDFGIASIAGETQVTRAGEIVGTAAYLSPEQAQGFAATPASDIYSLAVVAYELLCGHRPFSGEDAVMVPANLEPGRRAPSEAAARVLAQGLATKPAQRPLTARAFIDALGAALGDLANPTGAALSTAVTPPAAPRRSRRRAALAGLALVAAAAGTAAALLTGNGTGDGTPASTAHAASPQRTAASTPTTPRRTRTGARAPQAHPAPQTLPAAQTGSAPQSGSAPRTGSGPRTGPQSPAGSTPAAPPLTSAAALNNAGFAKLQAGDVTGALPLLEQARAAFQADGDNSSLDYAYNLYNLAWALRLAGRPTEAIPLLQERLRISSFKRGVVQTELRAAQLAAGQPGPAGHLRPAGPARTRDNSSLRSAGARQSAAQSS